MNLGLGIGIEVLNKNANPFNPLSAFDWDSYYDVTQSVLTFDGASGDGGEVQTVGDLSGNGNDCLRFGATGTGFEFKLLGYANTQALRKMHINTMFSYTGVNYTNGLSIFAAIRIDVSTLAAGALIPISLGSSQAKIDVNLSGDVIYRNSTVGAVTLAGAITDFDEIVFISLSGDENGMILRVNDTVSASFVPNGAFDTSAVLRWADNTIGKGIAEFYIWGASYDIIPQDDLIKLKDFIANKFSAVILTVGLLFNDASNSMYLSLIT